MQRISPKLNPVLDVPIQICMETKEHWIYYLKLTRELPREYFDLDQQFKQTNKSLVPITLRGLLEFVNKNKKIHVLIIVRTTSEVSYFHRRVKKIMKYLMKTGNCHLYIGSTFSSVNDPGIMRRELYSFAKLPVKMENFCQSISHMIDVKESNIQRWPGGTAPRLSLAS